MVSSSWISIWVALRSTNAPSVRRNDASRPLIVFVIRFIVSSAPPHSSCSSSLARFAASCAARSSRIRRLFLRDRATTIGFHATGGVLLSPLPDALNGTSRASAPRTLGRPICDRIRFTALRRARIRRLRPLRRSFRRRRAKRSTAVVWTLASPSSLPSNIARSFISVSSFSSAVSDVSPPAPTRSPMRTPPSLSLPLSITTSPSAPAPAAPAPAAGRSGSVAAGPLATDGSSRTGTGSPICAGALNTKPVPELEELIPDRAAPPPITGPPSLPQRPAAAPLALALPSLLSLSSLLLSPPESSDGTYESSLESSDDAAASPRPPATGDDAANGSTNRGGR